MITEAGTIKLVNKRVIVEDFKFEFCRNIYPEDCSEYAFISACNWGLRILLRERKASLARINETVNYGTSLDENMDNLFELLEKSI